MEQASGSAEDWVDIATVNTSVAHSDSSRTSARGAQQPSSSEGAGPLIEELAEVLGELKSYFRWPRAASGFKGFLWGGRTLSGGTGNNRRLPLWCTSSRWTKLSRLHSSRRWGRIPLDQQVARNVAP